MIVNTGRSRNLDVNSIEPYSIVKRCTGGAYELLDATGHLYPRKVPSHELRVVTLPSASDISHEVEEIIDERKVAGLQEYLVRWKGSDQTYDTWEPVSMFDTLDAISDCHR